MKKTFLSCQCGMLVGCRSFIKGELLCETDCEHNQQLQCTLSFDEMAEESEKSKKPMQIETFLEECDYCQSDGDFIEDMGAPAFLSEVSC